MEFRILGPLEVVDGPEVVAVGKGKQRALLAILLLNANEVVSTDRLVDELWGQRPPETAAHSVEVYVSQLRKALGRDSLLTRKPGYELRVDSDRIDLHRFERLLAEGRQALGNGEAAAAAGTLGDALRLWRGPALAEFEYESFAQAAIRRLDELRLAALEDRIEAELRLGNHAALVPELEALTAQHPLRERPRGQLMLALYRSGRQAEALEAYQEARRALVDQLGIDPSPALQRLEQAILRQDDRLDPDEHEPARARSVSQSPASERSILVAFRDEDELEILLGLASPLARSRSPHELIVVRLLDSAEQLEQASARLEARRGALLEAGVVARVAALTSTDPASDTVRFASQQDVDLLLLDARRLELDPGLRTTLLETPCDVALVAGGGGSRDGAVVVPFGGGEHDWSALELGAWLASGHGAPLRVCGPAADPVAGKRDASRLLATASLVVQQLAGVVAEPVLQAAGVEGVLEAAADARAVVMGLSDRWQHEGAGDARRAIAVQSRSPTLLVRRGLRPGGLAPVDGLTRFTWSIAGR